MMSDQSLGQPPIHSAGEKRLLLALKLLVVLVVLGLIRAKANDGAWPLVTWPMFDQYGAAPPDTTQSTVKVAVVSADGQIYEFWEPEIYGQIPSGDGKRAMALIFTLKGAQQQAAFKTVIGRVRQLLPGVDIAEIQAWNLTWTHVQADQSPPFDPLKPDERTLIGTISVADVEASR